jgi:hypothetical protein
MKATWYQYFLKAGISSVLVTAIFQIVLQGVVISTKVPYVGKRLM